MARSHTLSIESSCNWTARSLQRSSTAYRVGGVKIPVIHGCANDSSPVTVLKTYYLDSSGREIDLLANEVIVGAHLDPTGAVVRQAVVGFTNLEEWAACRLVRQSTGSEGFNCRFCRRQGPGSKS